MSILDVAPIPKSHAPEVIMIIVAVIFCLYLLSLGIYLIIARKKNKDKN